jgi:hypothetical protein
MPHSKRPVSGEPITSGKVLRFKQMFSKSCRLRAIEHLRSNGHMSEGSDSLRRTAQWLENRCERIGFRLKLLKVKDRKIKFRAMAWLFAKAGKISLSKKKTVYKVIPKSSK